MCVRLFSIPGLFEFRISERERRGGVCVVGVAAGSSEKIDGIKCRISLVKDI